MTKSAKLIATLIITKQCNVTRPLLRNSDQLQFRTPRVDYNINLTIKLHTAEFIVVSNTLHYVRKKKKDARHQRITVRFKCVYTLHTVKNHRAHSVDKVHGKSSHRSLLHLE
jgi:hypothetical protein